MLKQQLVTLGVNFTDILRQFPCNDEGQTWNEISEKLCTWLLHKSCSEDVGVIDTRCRYELTAIRNSKKRVFFQSWYLWIGVNLQNGYFLRYSESDWCNIYFVPVVCFVVYNLGDIIGKHMAVWIQWPGPSKRGQWTLMAITLARIALIPLLFYCNLIPNDRKTDVIFQSEYW